jgi:hypothetical protein
MKRHYRNHTTPGAPQGSGAAHLAGAPQPTRIPPPPGTQHGERGPTPQATKSGPNSEDKEEFDELDSDMDVDPYPRTSERRSANGNAYPTPPNYYPSHSASPHLHPARSSPLPRRRGASRSPSYSPRGERHPYSYSPPLQPSVPCPDLHCPRMLSAYCRARQRLRGPPMHTIGNGIIVPIPLMDHLPPTPTAIRTVGSMLPTATMSRWFIGVGR